MASKNKTTIAISKELHDAISKIADYAGLSLEQVVMAGVKREAKYLINDRRDPMAYDAIATSMHIAEAELTNRYQNQSKRSKRMREFNKTRRGKGEKLHSYIAFSPFHRPITFKAYPSTKNAQGQEILESCSPRAESVFVE
jgi:hypothetical protein